MRVYSLKRLACVTAIKRLRQAKWGRQRTLTMAESDAMRVLASIYRCGGRYAEAEELQLSALRSARLSTVNGR